MQTVHMTGHFQKWNVDAHFQNNIGHGFIFCAYSFPDGFFGQQKINGYSTSLVLQRSFLDLQYFGKKAGANLRKGKLHTYPFHPVNNTDHDATNVYMESAIRQGIKYQLKNLGLNNIIIPNYYENDNVDDYIYLIKTINKWLTTNRQDGIQYYMTITLANHTIIDEDKVDRLLYALTDQSIVFDGYYISCEAKPEFKQKISVDFKYLKNLAMLFRILKKQNFKTIYAYANWDALIFLSLTDIDYISIGTYENLRNFSIKRFTEQEDGGPSKGFYFSEKLLNFVKSPLLDLVRPSGCLPLIKNERNIFSDVILAEDYPWSNQKPEVHKNYLLAVDRLLNELASVKNVSDRRALMIQKIDAAEEAYNILASKNVHLPDESRNYHLSNWKTFLRSQK